MLIHNNKSAVFICLCLLWILFLTCTYAYADDTILGRTPDGVYPMTDSDIVMESESVFIRLEAQQVECTFTFKNTGKEKSILMGFPKGFQSNSDAAADSNLEITRFQSYVNGSKVEVVEEKGTHPKVPGMDFYTSWYTFQVHFDENSVIRVQNTYALNYTTDSMGNAFLGYVLRTGAAWKDTIGYAKIVFDLGSVQPYQIKSVFPYNFRFDGNQLVWEKSNFEPIFNLKLVYNIFKEIPEYAGYLEKDKHYFLSLEQKILGANPVTIEKYREKAISDNQWIAALYLESKLPKKTTQNKKPVIQGLLFESNPNSPFLYSIRGQMMDPDMDIENVQWQRWRVENNDEILEEEAGLHDRQSIGESDSDTGLKLQGKYMENTFFSTLEKNKKYKIRLIATDSLGQTASKTFDFPILRGNNTIRLRIQDPVIEINGFRKWVDEESKIAPIIFNNRTFLPIRSVAKALGGNIHWEDQQKQMTLVLASKTLQFRIASARALVDGVPIDMGAAPQILRGKALIPLRFVIENLGYEVVWNREDKSITIRY